MRAACGNEDRLMCVLLETPSLDALLLLEHCTVLLCEVERLHKHTEVLRQPHILNMMTVIAAQPQACTFLIRWQKA